MISPFRHRAGRWARSLRRGAYETFNDDRYSRPSLSGIESFLDTQFRHPGTFVEVGAFDGFEQSNTYWLERFRGWSGILIEPIPKLAERAGRLRGRSTVVQAGLTSEAHSGTVATFFYAGLMSIQSDASNPLDAELHVESAKRVQPHVRPRRFDVELTTLTAVLEKHQASRPLDLLCVDVEGMEAVVLHGLDFFRFQPRGILVEMNDPDSVRRAIPDRLYSEVASFGVRDSFFSLR